MACMIDGYITVSLQPFGDCSMVVTFLADVSLLKISTEVRHQLIQQ